MLLSRARLLLAVLCALGAISSAIAAEPKVTAVLSSSETGVGQPVQLEIKVTGSANPKPPGDFNVDGLEIQSAGVSRQYQMQNFNVNYSFTYNYTIMPLRPGTFKIPSQMVDAGGKSMPTPELTLNVVNSGRPTSRAQRGNRGGGAAAGDVDPGKIGFLELLLPKTTAYVGEVVPAQARLGFNMRAPVESIGAGVQIAGQGFTTQKFPEPRQTIETLNGTSYQTFIFKTAISPARAGKIEIGPAEANPVVRVARPQARNPSLPRDVFDDPFFNNFFNDPAFAPSMPKEVKLASEPASLEVKPLPPNAPPGFGGAVGTFTMKVEANPKKAKAGDPITITATISGRGNFDRVAAPSLDDDHGWHRYPSSDKFKQDDDVGISGDKTFETVLSANERKDKLPPLSFSFFDPVKEKYVTLRSNEIPLQIEGPVPTPTATTNAAQGANLPPPNAITPPPAPKPQEQDILYQLNDRPALVETFAPLYTRRSFWLMQLLPLLGLMGFVAWKVRESRLANREAQRTARLQQEAAEVQRRLRLDSTAEQYFADASRAVQLKTALVRNLDPNIVDAESAASAFRLDDARRTRLEQLFAQRDEMRYSGVANGNGQVVSPQSRQEILELVESLES